VIRQQEQQQQQHQPPLQVELYRDPTAAYNHHSNGGLGAVYQPAGIGQLVVL